MGHSSWIAKHHAVGLPIPLPLVEIADDRRVLIEHHRGVSSYTSEQVSVCVRYGQVFVAGSGLRIARMTREQLVICGSIDEVKLLRTGEKHER